MAHSVLPIYIYIYLSLSERATHCYTSGVLPLVINCFVLTSKIKSYYRTGIMLGTILRSPSRQRAQAESDDHGHSATTEHLKVHIGPATEGADHAKHSRCTHATCSCRACSERRPVGGSMASQCEAAALKGLKIGVQQVELARIPARAHPKRAL